MLLTNYHTHTTYCDGKNTPEEMIKSAIEKKFNILGFSSHSMFPFGSDWHIQPRKHLEYISEIKELAKKYRSEITILCGFEADYIEGISYPSKKIYETLNPDYLIGSVHYLVTKKGNFTVDDTSDKVKKGIEYYFNGNSKNAVCEYFYTERKMIKDCDFTIIGHPDLFRKRNSELNLFNENELWYRKELKEVAREIEKSGKIVEINTGAIARKAMNDIYPSEDFLKILFDKKIPITINSDSHSINDLDCAFDKAYSVAKKIGYTEVAYIDEAHNIKFQKI